MGVSLAFFCALWMLSAARAHTEMKLRGDQDANAGVVVASLDAGSGINQREPEPIQLPDSTESALEIEDINELRAIAIEKQEAGAWFEAVDAWTAVTRHPDTELEDLLALARVQEQVGDTLSARASLNRACVRFPDNPEGYIAFGSLDERLGNLEAARFQYEIGLGYCPGNPTLRESLRRIERELGATPPEPNEFDWESWADFTGSEDEFEPGAGEEVSSSESDSSQAESDTADLDGTTDDNERHEGENILTLIGPEPEEEVEEPEGTGIAGSGDGQVEGPELLEVLDMSVSASDDAVTVEVITDRPAAFSTSSATDPPRLLVRLPDARLDPGASIDNSVTLNVPPVERVNLIEGSSDNKVVILVIYLGEESRHSVTADARAVRVSIWRTPETDAG